MPNRDFYATPQDHEPLLDWVHVLGAGPPFSARRVTLNPAARGGAKGLRGDHRLFFTSEPSDQKAAAAKIGSRVVLPGALKLWVAYERGFVATASHAHIRIARNVSPYYTLKSKETPMTTEATLTSKGQTTIPKEIREGLRMKTGDRMTFTLLPDGTVLMRVKNKSAMSVAGRLFKKGRKALPIEDLSR